MAHQRRLTWRDRAVAAAVSWQWRVARMRAIRTGSRSLYERLLGRPRCFFRSGSSVALCSSLCLTARVGPLRSLTPRYPLVTGFVPGVLTLTAVLSGFVPFPSAPAVPPLFW
ncbi:hypothetical protein HZS_1045 [Henneguya salminicola]|nr:hypothetical protein HZS_1045 [Henneguya salminicola]